MVNFVTSDNIRAVMNRQNNIYLTQSDADYILSQINQDEIYNKHKDRVKVEIWDGRPINGVDVSKGRKMKRDPKPILHELLKILSDEETYKDYETFKKRMKEFAQNNPLEIDDPSDQFIKSGQGHAYLIYIDGNLVGFQPHHPGIQGWHALTHKTKPHPITGQIVDKCPTCGQEHDIEQIMNDHKDEVIKNLASSEIMTKVLYMAQEIYDKRMETLGK